MTRKKAVRAHPVVPENLPAILTTLQVASLMNVNRSTVYTWTTSDEKLASCIIRRTKFSTWWSTQKLRDAGYLTKGSP